MKPIFDFYFEKLRMKHLATQNDPSKNELIVDMEDSNRLSRKEKRADMWFDKDIFKGKTFVRPWYKICFSL